MRLYLKLFFLFGVPVWFLMQGVASLNNDFGGAVLRGAIVGAIYGLIMSLVVGTRHIRKTRNMSSPDGVIRPRQFRTALLDLSLDATYEKCLAACRSHGVSITEQHLHQGRIEGTTRKGWWWGWGEKIVVQIVTRDRGKTRVTVSSAPKLRITFLDYGRGYENVEAITTFLRL